MGKKIKINNPALICVGKDTVCDLKEIAAGLMKNSKDSLTYNDVIRILIDSWKEKR